MSSLASHTTGCRGLVMAGLLLAAAGAARAQVAPARRLERLAPVARKPAPLPAAQVEEALRLLPCYSPTGYDFIFVNHANDDRSPPRCGRWTSPGTCAPGSSKTPRSPIGNRCP